LKNVGVPLIYYANDGGSLYSAISQLEVDVVGVDWRTPLSAARRALGPNKAVQGNMDPAALFSSPAELKRHVDYVLSEAGPGPGHIFNLGHGIWQETDPDMVKRLVDYVHEASSRAGGSR
jgi:uroporphyrinogen decarboxylase